MIPTTKLSAIFLDWWKSLGADDNDFRGRDRDGLARLRRLDLVDFGGQLEVDLAMAFTIPAYRRLRARVSGFEAWDQAFSNYTSTAKENVIAHRERHLAIAAHLIAFVGAHTSERHPATALGGVVDSARIMKERRFLSLIRCNDEAELFDQARRVAMLLGSGPPVDVGVLGVSFYEWFRSPVTRRTWARFYYWLNISDAESSKELLAGNNPE